MMPVLMKLEMRTPQKMKEYSLGIELGRSKYLAMRAMMMAKKTLVMAETTEAPI